MKIKVKFSKREREFIYPVLENMYRDYCRGNEFSKETKSVSMKVFDNDNSLVIVIRIREIMTKLIYQTLSLTKNYFGELASIDKVFDQLNRGNTKSDYMIKYIKGSKIISTNLDDFDSLIGHIELTNTSKIEDITKSDVSIMEYILTPSGNIRNEVYNPNSTEYKKCVNPYEKDLVK